MKKIIILIISLFLASCASTLKIRPDIRNIKTEPYSGPKRKVAVVDFQVKSAYGKARLGSAVTDIMVTELFNTGRFLMIERDKIAKIIEEQTMGAAGLVDSSTAVEIGKLLGAGTMITGSVSEFGVKTTGSDFLIVASKKQSAESTVDVRVIDAKTGRIIYTGTGRGVAIRKTGTFLGLGTTAGYDETLEGSAMRASIVNIINEIVSRINEEPWACSVVDVDGSDVYLNAGKMSNLRVGTKLKVMKKGKEIRNEEGALIGTIDKEKGVIEVINHFGNDGSIAVVVKGEVPGPGDVCKFE